MNVLYYDAIYRLRRGVQMEQETINGGRGGGFLRRAHRYLLSAPGKAHAAEIRLKVANYSSRLINPHC